jgi:hypothetical protein
VGHLEREWGGRQAPAVETGDDNGEFLGGPSNEGEVGGGHDDTFDVESAR